jgi:hypothetical protein
MLEMYNIVTDWPGGHLALISHLQGPYKSYQKVLSWSNHTLGQKYLCYVPLSYIVLINHFILEAWQKVQ